MSRVEEETTLVEDPDEKKIGLFRAALADWKRQTFFPQLNNGVSADTCIEEASRLREQFAELLLGKSVSDIPPLPAPFLVILGTPDTWTETLRVLLNSALLTDLFEYPLTFDTEHIENILEEKRDGDANRPV